MSKLISTALLMIGGCLLTFTAQAQKQIDQKSKAELRARQVASKDQIATKKKMAEQKESLTPEQKRLIAEKNAVLKEKQQDKEAVREHRDNSNVEVRVSTYTTPSGKKKTVRHYRIIDPAKAIKREDQ